MDTNHQQNNHINLSISIDNTDNNALDNQRYENWHNDNSAKLNCGERSPIFTDTRIM